MSKKESQDPWPKRMRREKLLDKLISLPFEKQNQTKCNYAM